MSIPVTVQVFLEFVFFSQNHHLSYSATFMRYLRVPTTPAVFPSLITYRTWVFTVHNDLGTCCAHDGETSTDELL